MLRKRNWKKNETQSLICFSVFSARECPIGHSRARKAPLLAAAVPAVASCFRGGFLLCVFVALVLSGCGESESRLSPLSVDAVVLAYGDSLTYGTGVAEDQAYPSVLQALLNRTVINAGLPGEISRDGLRRLPGVLDKEMPALLILCHGGNDILRRKNKKRTRANVAAMVELAKARGIQVVMLGVPNFGLLLDAVPFYEEVAQEFDVPIDVDILPSLLSDNEFKSDTVHPNAAGYARMARAVHELLKGNGAISQ